MQPERQQQVQAVVDELRRRGVGEPRFGVILGTGAGELGQQIEQPLEIPYEQLPDFPRSTVIGHRGQFVCGRLGGAPVIAMQGRFHLYEGYPVNQATLPIDVMARLGVNVLFVSNASGGLAPWMASGEMMAIDSQIDLMFARAVNPAIDLRHSWNNPAPRWGYAGPAYDPQLIEGASAIARKQGFPLHRGVYAGVLGPNYETRAEYRFLRALGADVVGMSTVPEVQAAQSRGMRVLGLSIISNVARPDALESTSGEEVVDAAAAAAPHLRMLVEALISQLRGSSLPA